MMKIMALAASAALVACSGQPAASVDNSAAGNAATAVKGPAPAAADARQTAPGAAYRPFFDERWPSTGAAVTPDEVVAMMERQGADAAIIALSGSGENSRFDTAMRGIATGDPAWLAIAPRIAAGLDAGASTSFALATQDALTTNPAGSLRLMSQLADGQAGCTYDSMEPAPGQVRAFYTTAIASVEAIGDPALATLKATCLSQLRAGLASEG